jgi:hypothetical protein
MAHRAGWPNTIVANHSSTAAFPLSLTTIGVKPDLLVLHFFDHATGRGNRLLIG